MRCYLCACSADSNDTITFVAPPSFTTYTDTHTLCRPQYQTSFPSALHIVCKAHGVNVGCSLDWVPKGELLEIVQLQQAAECNEALRKPEGRKAHL